MTAIVICFLFLALPLRAMQAGEALSDAALEKRAVLLGAQLRCVVCQSESINDSPAELAGDLRHLVREKLLAGWDDDRIIGFIHERYGDYVLLNPPVKPTTWVLWAMPWALLLGGMGVFGFYLWRKKTGAHR